MTRKRASIGKIGLNGALTVRSIDALRSQLRESFAQHSTIELDFAGATEVDLNFVQLVIALRKSAQQSGKSVRLARPASGPLLSALTQSGIVNLDGSRESADDRFWLKGEGPR